MSMLQETKKIRFWSVTRPRGVAVLRDVVDAEMHVMSAGEETAVLKLKSCLSILLSSPLLSLLKSCFSSSPLRCGMTQQGLWQKLIKKHATKACNGAPAADLAELAKTIKEKHPGRVPTIAVDVLPLLHVFVHTIKVAAVQHAGWSVARELFTLLTIWYNNKGFRLAGWRS